jgi:hypothetical protein
MEGGGGGLKRLQEFAFFILQFPILSSSAYDQVPDKKRKKEEKRRMR